MAKLSTSHKQYPFNIIHIHVYVYTPRVKNHHRGFPRHHHFGGGIDCTIAFMVWQTILWSVSDNDEWRMVFRGRGCTYPRVRACVVCIYIYVCRMRLSVTLLHTYFLQYIYILYMCILHRGATHGVAIRRKAPNEKCTSSPPEQRASIALPARPLFFNVCIFQRCWCYCPRDLRPDNESVCLESHRESGHRLRNGV